MLTCLSLSLFLSLSLSLSAQIQGDIGAVGTHLPLPCRRKLSRSPSRSYFITSLGSFAETDLPYANIDLYFFADNFFAEIDLQLMFVLVALPLGLCLPRECL